MLAALWLLAWTFTAQSAEGQFKCFPSCSSTDGRFLVIASGTGLVTLSEERLEVQFGVPAGATSFTLGLFDGDGGGPDGAGTSHWDLGSNVPYSYTLYADPLADGTGSAIVEMSPGVPVTSSLTMSDNAWVDYSINTSDDARSPSGNYFYRLEIVLLDDSVASYNSFKLRTSGVVTIRLADQPFSYIAALRSLDEARIIYPLYPVFVPTTYDGTFRFFFNVPEPMTEISVWDGDFDFGDSTGLLTRDTDDPDTPNAPFLPPWATVDAVPEGVATGLGTSTGNPPDDLNPAAALLLRPPSIFEQLLFPDGQTFTDDNPSGNQEWEQYRISTDPFDPAVMDASTTSVPAGTYELRIQGVDMGNLNAVRLPSEALCVSEDFVPCDPLRPFLVGDTVFRDLDADGVQSGTGETGIAGVEVELVASSGAVIATATTDTDGHYSFPVEAGTYTVRIADGNSDAGGPLDGVIATTPVQATETVVDDNVLTYDFGYRGTGSIGDRVWYDLDGDGNQGSSEDGINGVTLELLDGNGDVLASTATSGDGDYSFDGLFPGSYGVRVVTSTLPAGLEATYDLDGTGTHDVAAVTLEAGDERTDVDFGYRGAASVGDRLWNDLDGDGVQDSGENGINGVTVELLDGGGNVLASTTTSGDGNYAFRNLMPGTYSVRVVSSTLPAGLVPTYDLDGTATPHVATFSLGAGAARTEVDFGYQVPPCSAGSFKDFFDSASFSNNDGTLSWSGPWIEDDVAGAGVSSGNVTVGNPYSGYLFLRDYPDTGTQPSAAREANLAGFASATLSFSFHVRTAVDPDDAVTVEVSNDGGASYSALETLAGFSGTATGSRSYDISPFISSNTRIRFRVSNNYGGSDELFKLDWVRIDGTCTHAPQTGSIGNRVWNDADGDGTQDSGESGINGVTVQLLDGSGTVVATTTTAGDGDYAFSGLAAGNYSVRIVSSTLPAGAVPTYDLDGTATAHVAAVTLTAGQNRTDADFGYRVQPACTAGYFKDDFNTASFSNDNGTLRWSGPWIESDVAGVGVSSGNVTVGSPYGGYLFLRDYPDTGTQPSAAREANLTGFSSATLSFSFHVRTAVDPDDAVTVEVSKDGGASYSALETLAGFSGTATGSRSYDISSFISSNTRIRFRVSNNYGAGDELFKVDWVRIDGTCTPAQQTGSIGNRVWNDADGDGTQDSGESGINGVTVQLLDGSGTVIATTTTAGDGGYTFGNLAAGNYSVRVVSSTLPAGTVPTYDFDGTATAHVAAVPLSSGQSRTDADFGYHVQISCTAGYFKDDFDTASFSNDNGTLSWSGPWIESDVAGTGVSRGNVTVGSPYSGYLFLRDYPDTGTQPSAAREADLAGFSSATLSFSFHVRTAVDPDDAVTVEVSKDGGASYSALETLKGFSGTATGSRNYDVSSFLSSNTRIRFRVSNNYGAGDELFKVDWVRIDGSCGPSADEQPGTGTIGYWKNHPEAWPVVQITIGGRTYTKSQAIAWMNTASRGDKTIDLFKQLVAAKLNVLIGNESSCIDATIAGADSWLAAWPPGSCVRSSSSAWATGGPLHDRLDDYNNGELCAPHRD